MKKSIHTDSYRDLIDILVNARKKAGLTQQELADKLRKPQSFVAKYEGLERRLDIAEYIRVGEHVGITVKVGPRSNRSRRISGP